jgi:hypothetical protein
MVDSFDASDLSMTGPGSSRYDIEMAYNKRNSELARKMELMLADKSAQEEFLWEQYEAGYLADECFRFPTLKDRGFKSCEIDTFEDYENSRAVDIILDTLEFYGEDADLANVLPSETQLSEWARNKLEQKVLTENAKIRVPAAKVIGYRDPSRFEEQPRGSNMCPFIFEGAIVSYDTFLKEQDKVACGGGRRYF